MSWGRVALRAVCALVGLWLVAPTLIIVPLAFTGQDTFEFPPSSLTFARFEELFSNPAWYQAFEDSFLIAVSVAVLATVLGTALALALARSRWRLRGTVYGMSMLPMMVPTVITGIAVYALFLDWRLVGTMRGIVLAHTALALPFVLVPVTASLQGFDRRLESAAASLGASPWRVFVSVTLPGIRPGVLTGALFAFVISFDELVVSLFLVSPTLRTLPVQMYDSVTREVDPTVAAASTVTLVLTTVLLMAVMVRRKGEVAQ